MLSLVWSVVLLYALTGLLHADIVVCADDCADVLWPVLGASSAVVQQHCVN